MRNPQVFNQVEQLKKSNGDPKELINNMISKYSPEQLNAFRQYANGFGITDEQLAKFGINVEKH